MNAVTKPLTFAEIRAKNKKSSEPVAEEKETRQPANEEAHPANVALDELKAAVAEVDHPKDESPREAKSPLQRYFAKAPAESKLIELRDKYKDFAPITNPAGLKEAMSALAALRKARLAIEAAREPIKELAKQALAEEKRLKAIIEPTETLVAKYRDDYEEAERLRIEEEERIKREAEEKEAKRIADIKKRINAIRMLPIDGIGKSSAWLRGLIDALKSSPCTDFEEFNDEAEAAKSEALRLIHEMVKTAEAAEAQAWQAKAEREALEAKALQEREARLAVEREKDAELEALRRELKATQEKPKPKSVATQIVEAEVSESEPEEYPPAVPGVHMTPLEAIAAKYNLAKWQAPALDEAWDLGAASVGQKLAGSMA